MSAKISWSAKLLTGVVVLACLVAGIYLALRRAEQHESPVALEEPSQARDAPSGKPDKGGKPSVEPPQETKTEPKEESRKPEEPKRPAPPPEGYPVPKVTDPQLSSFANPNRDVTKRIPPDFRARVPRVKGKDIEVVVRMLQNKLEDDVVRNEAAGLLRRSDYRKLTDRLTDILEDEEEGERFRRYCVQHLSVNWKTAAREEKEKIRDTLRESLNDRHPAVRREALLALVKMKDPKGRETAVSWLTGPEGEGQRDLAIRCVKELDLKQHIPGVRKCLQDKNESVRVAAIAALSGWGDVQSRSAFEEAAMSDSPRLRRAGKAALAKFAK